MRIPGSPDELARFWALRPAPVEGADHATTPVPHRKVSYFDPGSGKWKIPPEIEAEIEEWVRWEVDRRALRDAEEEGAE